MKRFTSWALTAACVLGLSTSLVQAQDVTLRGKVEDVSGTNLFIVDCTNVGLQSRAFDLNMFQGQHTEIVGTNVGTADNPLIEVTSIQVVPRMFEIGGNGSIGREFQLEVVGTPGDRAWIFPASGPGFAPVRSWGTFLLNAVNPVFATGVIPASGTLRIQVNIPNNPNLVGVQVFGQALVQTSTGIVLSNADCATIES